MTDNNSSSGLSACSIVCWLLAFAFGIFVAAALIGWTGMHGLLAAVLGLIAMLLAGWMLKGMFCADDASSNVSSTTAAAAVGAGAVATAAVTSSKPAAAKPVAKAAPAKKTAAKSTTTTKTKTAAVKKPAAAKKAAAPKAKAAAKAATTKKPAAKKTAAKSTTTAKTKTAAAKKPAAAKAATPAKKAATPKAKAATKSAATKTPAAKKATAAKFYTKAPAKVDDLKLISGVGPKLEKTLNDIGVYKYEQVAVWKKADIKKVDDQLKFKGRIERDNWMKQAKVLAKGGDTEFSKKKRK